MSQSAYWLLLMPVGAYLVGSIPFGLFVGYLRGVDVRKQGSGNIGATNVGRVLGFKWGVLVFALDVIKGAAPTAAAAWIVHHYYHADVPGGLHAALGTLAVMAVQAACVFGHVWPVYLGFKGGKGVATSLGILLGYWPYLTLPGLLAFGTWGLVLGLFRYVSAASIIASAAFPVYVLIFGNWQHWPRSTTWMLAIFSAVMAGLILVRHRANIKRLMAGTEPKIGQKGRHEDVHAEVLPRNVRLPDEPTRQRAG